MKRSLVTLLLLLCCSPLWAAEVELRPLQVSNQAPLAALCGIPTLDRARLLAEGSFELGFRWDLASNYTTGSNLREQLIFDGESSRLELRVDRGFDNGWEAGMEIPVIAHRQGNLDSFIEGWHDFFGLSQGGRDTTANDQLNYSYQQGGNSRVLLKDETTGLGDVRLLLSRQLSVADDSAVALHASLELPTGDADKLLGSGSFDLAVWISGEHLWRPAEQRLALHWGGGLLASDSGDVLSSQRRPLVGTATLGLAWSAWPMLALQLQLDANSSLFEDSGLRQIDEAAAQLAIGGALALGEQTRLELAVVEDVAVDTAPDVTFHLALSHRF
ncbi:DUF3187 family protein [Malonomonas rubra]|uniref:DUF3187 family protein n=1 Tax=Malonomonas rubra TaxID=57040 RepID=UPI0026EB3687|nr:DUF3187 family protein [Malonomonas rubra]